MRIRITPGLLLAGLLLAAAPALAQEDGSSVEFENREQFEAGKEEFGRERQEKEPETGFRFDQWHAEGKAESRFGGYGGPLVGYLNLDLSCFDPMTRDRGLDGFSEDLLLIGGYGGMAYRPRDSSGWMALGGFGFGAPQQKVSEGDLDATMSMGGGGLFFEYHQPVVPKAEVLLGALIGAGAITLTAEGADLGLDPGQRWSANRTFFMAYPYLGVSYAATKWMRVTATGGYLFTPAGLSGSEFEIEDSGMDMADGDLFGGPQAILSFEFGYWPVPK